MHSSPNRLSGRILAFAAFLALGLLVTLPSATPARAADAKPVDATATFRAAVNRWLDLVEPPAGTPPQMVVVRATLTKADGSPAEVAGATLSLNYQYPDRLRAVVNAAGEQASVGRNGQELWALRSKLKFGVLGKPGVLKFKSDPSSIDTSTVPPFELPVSRLKIRLALALTAAEAAGNEKVGEDDCQILKVTLRPAAAEMLGVETLVAHLWLRAGDLMPRRVTATDGKFDVRVDVAEAAVATVPPADFWPMKPAADDKIETVAVSHLMRCLAVGPQMVDRHLPVIGPATGKHHVVAKFGKGRLENYDGTRVLLLKGSPEEMGQQHGKLLKPNVRDVAEKMLYGIGVGSSFARGSWFFGEIESAQARLEPFVDARVKREMDALADAAGVTRQEARLANFFPELFHCSGFALLPGATADGHVYHGRVLDYLKGVGLEENAVVIVHQPDDGRHAWVNVGYAGFAGSVTAMNEKGISVGEMGGHGYGDWDGKPMAQLVREVMEKASTLDEAVAIMKAGPRTCEYYYVIADGKSKRAVGVGATPKEFGLVEPGATHARLPNPSPETVLMSAGDRYDVLSTRVKAGWGKFDADAARMLMSRPVAMTSNIQSVLFVPDTLDFHVANADGRGVASQARYTKYNLGELLKSGR